jgi:translocation and assembly module TamB
MKWKKITVRACKWAALSMVVLLLLTAALLGLAQTEGGKRRIAGLISSALSKEGEGRVEIVKLTGFIPFYVQTERLTLVDGSGEWLAIEKLVMRCSPLALIKGQIRIKELSAAYLRLNRLPRPGETSSPTTKKSPIFPEAVQWLQVEHLAVEQMLLGEAVLGQKAIFRMEARFMASSPGDERVSSLVLERTDGARTRLFLNATLRGGPPVLEASAEFEEVVILP